MKEYQAFQDLSKTIDDFNEMVPLLELMTNKAMQKRHWLRISELLGRPFDIESEGFMLKHVLEAPLLKFREEIEVLTDLFIENLYVI